MDATTDSPANNPAVQRGGWKHSATRLAARADTRFDALRRRFHGRMGIDAPYTICAYRGYGALDGEGGATVTLRGRVLAGQPIAAALDDDSMWANLLATYRRLESDEVAGARVEISLAGSVTETVTDHEGYYAAEIALSQVGPQPWITGSARLLYPATEPAVVAEVAAVVPRAADFAVVSDIDDTILVSDATHWLRAARRLFLQNARGRLTFPGVPEFYTALQAGAAPASFNPIFYVSSSPWNLYDLLTDFMAFQEIPPGPLFLRDYGLEQPPLEGYGTQGGHAGHKTLYIEQLLAAYPHLPFVLIGDSGQKDPEIYAAIAVRHPDRIRSIYIRDIAPALLEPRDAEVRSLARATSVHGVPMLLVADSAAAHAHAAQLGLVRG